MKNCKKTDKKKIMIVEDEPVSVLAIASFIRNLGYDIFGNYSVGEEAVNAVKDECPDLVLMDIGLLGDYDGMRTAQEIEKICDVNIIYITGMTLSKDTIYEMVNQKWFKGFIPKPYDNQVLTDMIRKALEEKKDVT